MRHLDVNQPPRHVGGVHAEPDRGLGRRPSRTQNCYHEARRRIVPILLCTSRSSAPSGLSSEAMSRLMLLGIIGACAFAQAPSDPPPIVELVRKPGNAATAIRPYGDAHAAMNVVGMTAMTGLPETWLAGSALQLRQRRGHRSRAGRGRGLQRDARQRAAAQDDVLAPAHTLLLRYQPDLSYRPDQAIRLFPRAATSMSRPIASAAAATRISQHWWTCGVPVSIASISTARISRTT